MNNLNVEIKENKDLGLVVSSRTIAEQLDKRPADVIRSIENILTNANVDSLIIPDQYKDKKGELRKEYLLTKDGFTLYMFNIQGHNDFKLGYIQEFNRMQEALNNKQLLLPGTYKEALQQLIESVEKKEQLELLSFEQQEKN